MIKGQFNVESGPVKNSQARANVGCADIGKATMRELLPRATVRRNGAFCSNCSLYPKTKTQLSCAVSVDRNAVER